MEYLIVIWLQEMDIEGEMPEKISCYGGIFYNYFSIGEFNFLKDY
jgi:hypothetical protein